MGKRKAKIKTALIVSPIMALYGMAPFYAKESFDVEKIIAGFVGLTFMILLFWLVNIWILSMSRHQWVLFFYSYVSTATIHLCVLLMMPTLPGTDNKLVFFVYPLISTLAVNSIVIIIIRVQTLKEKKRYI